MAGLAFENVTFGYGRHPAVHHLRGHIASGSLIAVVGPNGSGKSTLLKGIMGHIAPMEGHVHIEGCAPDEIAYLPQLGEIDRSFPASVGDLVGLGLWKRRGLFGGFSSGDRRRVADAIAAVHLDGFEETPIGHLSGGQLQRALFARAILQDAPLVLLDEPFTAVDMKTTQDLVDIILAWNREGRTVVAVLHDLDLVRNVFPDCMLLARDVIAWGRTADVLKPQNLQKARGMHEAWDEEAPWCEPAERAA